MTVGTALKREARVAFSRRAQPVWFRVVKWVLLIALAATFWRSPVFWWGLLVAFVLALALHLVWRWKTKGWTQPWGGWDDVDAAEGRHQTRTRSSGAR
jgi:hypothetical protein